MKQQKFTFKDVIKNEKLTFLVGAGCSTESPSNLPSGREMIDEIIKYTCDESEIENLFQLKSIRFEALVEIVRDRLDKNLRIIDYYAQCVKPNIQHNFLAETIINGNIVITTNFDNLIEYSLLQKEVRKEDILLIITEEDYLKNKINFEDFILNKKILIKIHGSPWDIINNRNTKKSLITTIKDLYKYKANLNIFSIESFKRLIIKRVLENRTLIVMGYSGSDDFDIIPTLKSIHNFKKIIWIKHISSNNNKNEKIYEIPSEHLKDKNSFKKVKQILFDIKKNNLNIKAYLVEADTTKLIKRLINPPLKIESNKCEINPYDWFIKNISRPNRFQKFYIPFKIYFDAQKYNDALRAIDNLLDYSRTKKSKYWERIALKQKALIVSKIGNIDDALKLAEESLKIAKNINNDFAIASSTLLIADFYASKGHFTESIFYYQKALKYYSDQNDDDRVANILNNLGELHFDKKEYNTALQYYNEAREKVEGQKKIIDYCKVLFNLAKIKYFLKDFNNSYDDYVKTLEIAEIVDNQSIQAGCKLGIGLIELKKKNYYESIKLFNDAFDLSVKIDEWQNKADSLYNLAAVFYKLDRNHDALKYCNEAIGLYHSNGISNTPRLTSFKDLRNIIKNRIK